MTNKCKCGGEKEAELPLCGKCWNIQKAHAEKQDHVYLRNLLPEDDQFTAISEGDDRVDWSWLIDQAEARHERLFPAEKA
jgi:hypothetical protein